MANASVNYILNLSPLLECKAGFPRSSQAYIEPLLICLSLSVEESKSVQFRYKIIIGIRLECQMFPHLKLLCWLFFAPLLVLTQSKETVFLIKFGVFLQLKQDSDNIINS